MVYSMNDSLTLFREMLRIRLIEEAIAKNYSDQLMRCPTHLSIGQEAVAVGVSSALNEDDKVYSSHRAHAHYLAKGGNLNRLIAELHGKSDGCTGGRGGSMHLCDLDAGFMASTAIVANSIPLAVGHSLNLQLLGKQAITVAYFGEGATEEGAFYESLNFAVVRKLPVLFVCENNRYSVYSPLSVRQPQGRSITKLANEIGCKAQEFDGNDVVQVKAGADNAKQHLLSGNGPYLLECHTYRHLEHCGPNWDDDLGYRPAEEVQHWRERCPIVVHEARLKEKLSPQLRQDMILEIESEISEAFALAKESDFPDQNTSHQYLYA